MPYLPILVAALVACPGTSGPALDVRSAGRIVATIHCGDTIEIRERGSVAFRIVAGAGGFRVTDRSGRVVFEISR